jgi:S-adenosylmethionine hydrolase
VACGLVSVLTDFGPDSRYAAELRAVVLAPAFGQTLTVVDLTHSVRRHQVREGAYLLRSAVRSFPPGTVHRAVVDPGVGTSRRGLAVRSGGHFLVGPDNGLLLPAARVLGRPEVREIRHPDLRRPAVSPTFWGRDVFAPCARWLALGFPFEEVGPRVPDPVELELKPPERLPGALRGEVVARDAFGNLSTNIPGAWLEDLGEAVWVQAGAQAHRASKVRTYGEAAVGSLLVLEGSDGYVEVAVREGDAGERLGLRPGDPVAIRQGP